ncbi:unnamed protein product [Cochlearia groenlandica]
MDRRSWLWRRKSSEKSPGETESTGSVSSHSERFSDDQRSQSPELITKPVTREEEATADIKILTERLSAALLNVSLKEDLAKQHAKVAEEAVSGWEKAENEAAVLKQQLDASLTKISDLEDRNSHLDSALKECVRQLWQGREEQNQKIEEAINKNSAEWETKKSELETRIDELQARLRTGKEEDVVDTVSVHEDLDPKLEALEKENSALKLQLLSKAEEVEIRTIERDLSTQAAESASKQQLEGIKKMTKLEAECRKLRVMARRSNELKTSVENRTRNSERASFSNNEMQSTSEMVSAKTSMASSVDIGLMDDFLEMEKLAAMPHSESNKGIEKPDAQSSKRKHELEASLHRVSELEEKLETIRAEKLELTICLNGTKKQLETSQSRLKETERKLTELQTLLRLTKDAKEAAEDGVKAATAKTEAVESRIRDVEAEAESLLLKMESLEESREKECDLSAKHISKCQELQDEISKLKQELEQHQEAESEPKYVKAFDDDYKLKQDKELAVAASKFAECQRTIASLGQRLQSLATLEDFLE